MIDDLPPLPQLEQRPFLTDSGLETTLIFIDGIDLPEFAAFPLLETSDGRRRLRHYFERHACIAREATSISIPPAAPQSAELTVNRARPRRKSRRRPNLSAIAPAVSTVAASGIV